MNNPISFTDSTGKNIYDDITGWVSALLIGAVQFAVGMATLDPARALTGITMMLEFALGPITLAVNGKLPKAYMFMNAAVVENSLTTEIFAQGTSYSLGAGMFLQAEWRMKQKGDSLEQTRQHEYGHYLQYQEWGGWAYLKRGLEEMGKCTYLEINADDRARNIFPEYKKGSYDKCKKTNQNK